MFSRSSSQTGTISYTGIPLEDIDDALIGAVHQAAVGESKAYVAVSDKLFESHGKVVAVVDKFTRRKHAWMHLIAIVRIIGFLRIILLLDTFHPVDW